jgi:hypothetical protein
MTKKKDPNRNLAKKHKNDNVHTRGKNAAGQTHGQWEQDPRRRGSHSIGAGDPPRMVK